MSLNKVGMKTTEALTTTAAKKFAIRNNEHAGIDITDRVTIGDNKKSETTLGNKIARTFKKVKSKTRVKDLVIAGLAMSAALLPFAQHVILSDAIVPVEMNQKYAERAAETDQTWTTKKGETKFTWGERKDAVKSLKTATGETLSAHKSLEFIADNLLKGQDLSDTAAQYSRLVKNEQTEMGVIHSERAFKVIQNTISQTGGTLEDGVSAFIKIAAAEDPHGVSGDVLTSYEMVNKNLKNGENATSAAEQYVRVLEAHGGAEHTEEAHKDYLEIDSNLKPGENRSDKTTEHIENMKKIQEGKTSGGILDHKPDQEKPTGGILQ